MQSAGMAAIAKHYPGHGAVVADSHVDLPVDRREYTAILDDIRPYERLINNRAIAGVMTAHVVYEEIDRAPATFSRAWIKNELRGRLGFDGAVFSDDLSMHATRVVGGMRDRARLALDAGCDMLLVCNDRPAAERVVAALQERRDAASLVRLARLRGSPKLSVEELPENDDWQAAHAAVLDWQERPALELDG
jgi:beta-N-acetylhexosaminidase